MRVIVVVGVGGVVVRVIVVVGVGGIVVSVTVVVGAIPQFAAHCAAVGYGPLMGLNATHSPTLYS